MMTQAKVIGIGGVFFRARDPEALAAWYETHLGITPAPTDVDTPVWIQSAGPTVFAPFADDTDYFPPDRQFMLNFRVTDLDSLLGALRAADIAVTGEQEMEGIGRFARIHDPEGNPIELWQPTA